MPAAGEVPEYWDAAKVDLSATDSSLAEVIARYEEPVLSSKGDLFLNLVSAIVGQQISTIAARTVWIRFENLVGEVNPKSVLSRSHEELRGCGLSGRKAEYILGIAEAWQSGYADIDWDSLSDEEVMDALGHLSDDHKQILLLRYYDDLSYAEIADVLQVKLGTVMSRLSRARMRLMAVMENNEVAN